MAHTKEDYKYTEVPVEKKQEQGDRRFLYITACTANITAFTCGVAFGWTSPVLPKLEGNTEHMLPDVITKTQASWIGSLLPLGAAIGPFAAGYMIDRIGRKNTLLIATVPLIIAFAMSAYASDVIMFYVARFLCGLSVGGIFTALPIYIGEIAEDEIRGSLGSFMQLFIVIGLLFSYAIGPFVSIQTYNLLSMLAPIIFMFTFYALIPETPQFKIAKGNLDEAEAILMKLRGKSRMGVIEELATIKASIDESMENKASFMDIFKSVGLKKALILSVGLVSLQQFSGINIILFYTQSIFEATGSSIPPAVSTILIGVVQVVGSFLTPMLVDKKGKRFLLVASALFMAISQGVLGGYFYLKDHEYDVQVIFWLPVACLIVYMIFYCLGFGPLPWAVMGELFPANVKSSASTATASGCWILAFLLTLFFGKVAEVIGNAGSFWIFAVCCVYGIFFVRWYLPETSGKSLQEIQDILSGKKTSQSSTA